MMQVVQPQEDVDLIDYDVDEEDLKIEEKKRLEYEQELIVKQLAGEKEELKEYETVVGSSDRSKIYSVDLDGVLRDMDHLARVNFAPHPRAHCDWRLVYMKRLNNNWIYPEIHQKEWHSWPALAAPLQVPWQWLREHCQK
jgi:hypothetical protein